MTIRVALACCVLSLIAGIMLGVAMMWESAHPYCPTEDSCVAMYYDHAWHIEKVRE